MPTNANIASQDAYGSFQTLEQQLKNASFKNPFTGVKLTWAKN